MEKINKSINNKINLEDKKIYLNDFHYTPSNHSNKTFNFNMHQNKIENIDKNIKNKNLTSNNNYRKELIMAKVIISELQEKINEINKEKEELEYQLEDSLNTIKILHSDYISLTDKFDRVNQNLLIDTNNNEKKINEVEEKLKELKTKNEQLNDELLTKQEINKLQEETLNRKINLLTKKLEKAEEELNDYKKRNKDIQKIEMNKNQINNENLELREDNIKISNKYNDEKIKFNEEIQEYKIQIKKLENENFILTKELKEKNDKLENEKKINFQYNKIDNFFKNTEKEINEKNVSFELINEKYSYLINEFDKYKIQSLKEKSELIEKINDLKKENEKIKEEYLQIINDLKQKLIINEKNNITNNNEEFEIIKEEKKYILYLFLKIAPNPKLIQQIIDINKEIIKLERQKMSIYNNNNKNKSKITNILPKIEEQINIFKNHLNSLEDELINVDFGSSKSNTDNSLSSSLYQ